jgi:hypothetical protein
MQNFGKIKTTFNTLLAESLAGGKETNKKIFGQFVRAIKESEILRTQFNVYYAIEKKSEVDAFKSSEYVKESINLLKKFKVEKILEENKKLTSILEKNKITLIEGYEKEELHENISNLIFNKTNGKNIDMMVESLSKVVNYVNTNVVIITEKNEKLIPNSILIGMLTDKFNEKYDDLTNETKEIIKISLSGTDDDKKNVLLKTKNECIELINDSLNESDVNIKSKLLDVKDYILRMEYVSENYISDITKMIELKEDLTN